MASRKGRKQKALELPVETIAALKDESSDSGVPQWKIVDQALRMYLGLDEGSTEAALERKLEEVEDKIGEVDRKARELEREREEMREQKELLAEQLSEIREKKAGYQDQLDDILDDLVSNPNKNVNAYMGALKQAATDEYGRNTKENIDRVRADLQSRRDERDLQIPDHRFKRTGAATTDASATSDGGQSEPDMRLLSEPEGDSE